MENLRITENMQIPSSASQNFQSMENLRITEYIQQNLLSATKWLKFMTILGIIGVALVFIAGIVMLFIPTYDGVPGAIVGVIYMLLTLLYIYPIKKSFDLIKNTREAMNNASQTSLEDASANFKSILKYFGILAIVCMAIYAMIFAVAFVVGFVSALA